MPCCTAVNCANRTEKGFRVFRFPANITRKEKWVQNMQRKQWTPTNTSFLCEIHFEDSQFESRRADGWKKLKQNAVPTLFKINKSIKKERTDVNNPLPENIAPVTTTQSIVENVSPLQVDMQSKMELCKTEMSEIYAMQEENIKLKKKLEEMENILISFLNDDQIQYLRDGKKHEWQNETIVKAMNFRSALSVHGYQYLCDIGYPLPDYNTITQRIKGFKFEFSSSNDRRRKKFKKINN